MGLATIDPTIDLKTKKKYKEMYENADILDFCPDLSAFSYVHLFVIFSRF